MTALLGAATLLLLFMGPLVQGAEIQTLTAAENPTIAPELMVVRLTGEITPGTGRELARALSTRPAAIERVLVNIQSSGGDLGEAESIAGLLRNLRQTARIDTLVRQGAMCASACIAIFAQGERRSAGGASVWVFHGACYPGADVPSIALTCRYLDLLRAAGVADSFLRLLVRQGYVLKPGALWASGYELFHVYDAGLITALLEPWIPTADTASRQPGSTR